jgi:hypothetical protein
MVNKGFGGRQYQKTTLYSVIKIKMVSGRSGPKFRAPTTLKSEGEVTSLSGADKREVRDNREKW